MTHTAPLLLPCCAKDISAADQPSPARTLHPIGKLLRERRLAQAALGMSIGLAVSTASFRYDSRVLSSKLLSVIIASVLTAAAAVVWNVLLLARLFPALAAGSERAGLAALLFPFFAVVDAFLNSGDIAWVPWTCLVGTVLIVTSFRVAPPPVITFKPFNWVR